MGIESVPQNDIQVLANQRTKAREAQRLLLNQLSSTTGANQLLNTEDYEYRNRIGIALKQAAEIQNMPGLIAVADSLQNTVIHN